MPPSRRRHNFTVISYHYDPLTSRRTDFMHHTAELQEHHSSAQRSSALTNSQHTTSTSHLYSQRNLNLRPLLCRREDEATEAARICYVNRSVGIVSAYFIVSPAFQRLVDRFSTDLSRCTQISRRHTNFTNN